MGPPGFAMGGGLGFAMGPRRKFRRAFQEFPKGFFGKFRFSENFRDPPGPRAGSNPKPRAPQGGPSPSPRGKVDF